jgi:hypothetical protein
MFTWPAQKIVESWPASRECAVEDMLKNTEKNLTGVCLWSGLAGNSVLN